MADINKLNRKEMYALFYYILYLTYHKGTYYQKYLKVLDKYAIDGSKIVSSYYSMGFDYLSIYCFDFILFNDTKSLDAVLSDKNVQKKSLPFFNNFLVLIDNLLSIVVDEKFKNILNVYKIRASMLKKTIESGISYTVDEICRDLTNPLLNNKFMQKVYDDLIMHYEVNSRTIYLDDDKFPKDKLVSNKFKVDLYVALIKEYVNYVVKKLKEGNLEIFNDLTLFFIKKVDLNNLINNLEKLSDDDYVKIALSIVNDSSINLEKYSDKFKVILNRIASEINFSCGEHIGNKLFKKKTGASVRIYINLSNSEYGYLFLKEYISKCMKMDINHDMKGFITTGTQNKDRAVLYVEVEELPTRIKILNEICMDHPEWIESFGTPLSNTGVFKNSYYGICHIGSVYKNNGIWFNKHFTYNDYCDYIFKMSFYSIIAKLSLDYKLVKDSKEQQLLSDWALLRNINVPKNDDYALNGENLAISGVNVNDSRFHKIIEKYINKLKTHSNLLKSDRVFESFKKRCMYLSNVFQCRSTKNVGNICISKIMEDYAKQELFEISMVEQSEFGGKKI